MFLFLLLTELFIGIFVHDRFIRPYAGDVLVVIFNLYLSQSSVSSRG